MKQEELSKLQEGDEEAWNRFRDQHLALVRSVASWRKWNFDPHTQQDVVQDILAGLPRALGNFRASGSFEYFLKKVCVHRCLDRLRREIRQNSRYESLTVADPAGGGQVEREFAAGENFDPVQELVERERSELLKDRVGQLDDTCRRAIDLFYRENLSYREIAEKLSITVNTVGSRLAKCLGKLRDRLLQDQDFREYFPPGLRLGVKD